MNKLTKIILISFLSSSLLGGCAKDVPQEAPKPRLVRAIKVGDSQLSGEWVPGYAKATRELELSFRIGGRMIERPVFVGDKVQKGDLIGRIDPTDYQLEVGNAEGRLEEAKANLRAAEADLKRFVNIQKEDPGAVSQTQIDRAREERDQAKANIKSLESTVQNAKVRLERTELRAPFDGTVVARYVEPFEDVQPKQPIVRVVDSSRIDFVVNLPESEISLLDDFDNVRVKFDAFPDNEIPAEVKEVSREASLTTRTYEVTLIMDQPEGIKILPGMSGKGTADYAPDQDPSGVVIPVSAVFTEERGSKGALVGRVGAAPPPSERPTYIWVIDEQNMTVKQREVKVGSLTAAGIAVNEGLSKGEWVVIAGAVYLEPDQKVRISQDRAGG